MRHVHIGLLTLAAAALGGVSGALSVSRAEQPAAASDGRSAPAPRAAGDARSVRRERVRVPSLSVVEDTALAVVSPSSEEQPHEALNPWPGPPIEVRVVHGVTGDTVSLAGVALAEGRIPRGRPSMAAPVPMTRAGSHFQLDVSPTYRDDTSSFTFIVVPPQDLLVGTDEAIERTYVRVSPFARRLRATVPLRRATEIDLDVRWEDGRRIRGGRGEFVVSIGGRMYEVPSRAPRRVEVPYLFGESVYAYARVGRTWAEVTTPLVSYAPHFNVVLRVPRKLSHDGDSSGVYRAPSCSVRGCGGPALDLPAGTSVLDMRVFLRDGRPAAGAWVSVRDGSNRRAHGRTRVDAEGRAFFCRLGAGTYSIEIEAVGMVPITATAHLEDGEHPVLHLIEPIGETVEITVLNGRGMRLPFARVELDTDYVGLAPGGVQFLDHFTGTDGICRVERMPAQRTGAVARWAGRSGTATWIPGEPLTITIAER